MPKRTDHYMPRHRAGESPLDLAQLDRDDQLLDHLGQGGAAGPELLAHYLAAWRDYVWGSGPPSRHAFTARRSAGVIRALLLLAVVGFVVAVTIAGIRGMAAILIAALTAPPLLIAGCVARTWH